MLSGGSSALDNTLSLWKDLSIGLLFTSHTYIPESLGLASLITKTQTSPPDFTCSSDVTASCSTSKRLSAVTRFSPAVSTRRLCRSRSSFFHMTVFSPTSRTTHVMSASSPSYTCTGRGRVSLILGTPAPMAAAPSAARTTAHTGEAAADVHMTHSFCEPSCSKHR